MSDHLKHRPQANCCCTPGDAWRWVDVLVDQALTGDRLSAKLLPRVIAHALASQVQR